VRNKMKLTHISPNHFFGGAEGNGEKDKDQRFAKLFSLYMDGVNTSKKFGPLQTSEPVSIPT